MSDCGRRIDVKVLKYGRRVKADIIKDNMDIYIYILMKKSAAEEVI